ncbi:MAG: alkanesulfonate monooxygenase SsuD [Patiriisocius sp.]|jgi:alkanesulfonate monooxygenase SsuD/methylene tetrahydromethanopterin reductase-like flavin-dependent oxidoreductase (luciferase family)
MNHLQQTPPLVGTVVTPSMLSGPWEARRKLVDQVATNNIDHVFTADHVSFINGMGLDGLMNAATIAAMHPTIKVCIGVYLLALRHPVPVARQLATLSESAPGRIILGVGVGGEDRHEMEVCEIDPKTRGRRTNECLEIIRNLGTGQPYSFKGEFFELENARIKPAITPSMPILVGGRADAAIRRAGIYAEGWLAVWCSANRFAGATTQVETIADKAGRTDIAWQHGLQVWVGVHDDQKRARELIAKEMQAFYKIPFEAFEKYSPYGTPEQIAEFLLPYKEAGCRLFNIKPCAENDAVGIDAVAKVRELLR